MECFPQLGALSDSPVIVNLFGIRGSRLFDEGGTCTGFAIFPTLTDLLSLSDVHDVDLDLTWSQNKLKECEDNPITFLTFYGAELPVNQG